MVDHHVAARHLGAVFDDGGAAGRDQRGLDVLLEVAAAFEAHLVEDGADDVEARHQVGAAVADEQAHRFVGLGGERLVARQRALGAVEQHVGRLFVDRLFHVERLQALLAVLAAGVEVALHHVVFMVDLRQAFGRLDQDHAVHAVGDVHADRRGGAVVDVDAFVERLEGELRLVAGRGEARRGAAAGAGDAVQVDIVRHLAARVVLQVELDRVALAHPDEAARHGAAEGPEGVVHAFGDRHFLLDDFEVDDHLGRDTCAGSAAARTAGWSGCAWIGAPCGGPRSPASFTLEATARRRPGRARGRRRGKWRASTCANVSLIIPLDRWQVAVSSLRGGDARLILPVVLRPPSNVGSGLVLMAYASQCSGLACLLKATAPM